MNINDIILDNDELVMLLLKNKVDDVGEISLIYNNLQLGDNIHLYDDKGKIRTLHSRQIRQYGIMRNNGKSTYYIIHTNNNNPIIKLTTSDNNQSLIVHRWIKHAITRNYLIRYIKRYSTQRMAQMTLAYGIANTADVHISQGWLITSNALRASPNNDEVAIKLSELVTKGFLHNGSLYFISGKEMYRIRKLEIYQLVDILTEIGVT